MEESEGMEFIPQQVFLDLQEIGNWKTRAAAIDSLQRSLQEVPDRSPQLLINLRQLIGFLETLVADPNFKVSMSSMQILGEVAVKAGRDITPHVSCITSTVVEKFADSKVMVRNAVSRLLLRLMLVVPPDTVLASLQQPCLRHTHWRVRYEGVHLLGQVMIAFGKDQLDTGQMASNLITALQDDNPEVKDAAAENLCLLRKQVGSERFEELIHLQNVSQATHSKIEACLDNPSTPLSAHGRASPVLGELLPEKSSSSVRSQLNDVLSKMNNINFSNLGSSSVTQGDFARKGATTTNVPLHSIPINNPFLNVPKKPAPWTISACEEDPSLQSLQFGSASIPSHVNTNHYLQLSQQNTNNSSRFSGQAPTNVDLSASPNSTPSLEGIQPRADLQSQQSSCAGVCVSDYAEATATGTTSPGAPRQPTATKTYSGIAQHRAKLRRASASNTAISSPNDETSPPSTTAGPSRSSFEQSADRLAEPKAQFYTSSSLYAKTVSSTNNHVNAISEDYRGSAATQPASTVQDILDTLGKRSAHEPTSLATDLVSNLRSRLNMISAQQSLLPPPTWLQPKPTANLQSNQLQPVNTTDSSNTSSPGLLSPTWSPTSSVEHLKPGSYSNLACEISPPALKSAGAQSKIFNHDYQGSRGNEALMNHTSPIGQHLEIRVTRNEGSNFASGNKAAQADTKAGEGCSSLPFAHTWPKAANDAVPLHALANSPVLEQARAKLNILQTTSAVSHDVLDSQHTTPRRSTPRPTSGRRAVQPEAPPEGSLLDTNSSSTWNCPVSLTASLASRSAWITPNASMPEGTVFGVTTPVTGSPVAASKHTSTISPLQGAAHEDWESDQSGNSYHLELSGSERRETWSPSKELRLANLKRRQQQKRAASANSGTPNGSLDEISSCASFPSFDSGSTGYDSTPVRLHSSPSGHSSTSVFYDSSLYGNATSPKNASERLDRTWNQPIHRGELSDTKDVTTPHSKHSTPRRSNGADINPTPPPLAIRRRTSSTADTCSISRDIPGDTSDTWDPALSGSTMDKTTRVLGRTRSKGSLTDASPTPPTPGSSRSNGAGFAISKAAVEELATADLMPIPEPDVAVRRVISKMKACNAADRKELDWQGQYEAFNDARRLVKFNPDVIKSVLHEFIVVAIPGVEQLRSYTCKNALMLFQEMFSTIGKALDKELDEIVPLLVKKASEISNAGRETWLASEADVALTYMIQNCSETRTASALLACATHKNMHARTRVASHLDEVVELPGARNALVNNWTLLERIFKQAAASLEEGSLDARTYGKRIIWGVKACVGNRTDFERLISSVQPDTLRRKVLDMVEGSNGPPPAPRCPGTRSTTRQTGSAGSTSSFPSVSSRGTSPSSLMSAPSSAGSVFDGRSRFGKAANHHAASGDNSVLNTCSNSAMNATSGGNSRNSRSNSIINSEMVAAAEKVLSNISSKDWRVRSDALKEVLGFGDNIALLPDNTASALLDALIGRLSDGNSKVNIQALEALAMGLQQLRERCLPSLNLLMPALVASISSSNDKVKSAATATLDCLLASVDAAMLLQNLSHCVANGNARGRPILAEKLCDVISTVYPTKPGLVVKYAVPAALSLLHDVKSDSRAACQALVVLLSQLLGPGLFDHANGASYTKLQELLAGAGR